jgi:Raf kinase inhibitor-like YbhB/YbcL family protein
VHVKQGVFVGEPNLKTEPRNEYETKDVSSSAHSYYVYCQRCGLQPKKGEAPMNTITVSTPAFPNGGAIPNKYANHGIAGGQNVSLPLSWSSVQGAKSYAVFMYDTNPVARNFVHWAMINILPTVSTIPEGASGTPNMPMGCKELINNFGTKGYGGPQPPAGTGRHVYVVKVFALNAEMINLQGAVSYNKFMSAIDGKMIGQGEITGWLGK